MSKKSSALFIILVLLYMLGLFYKVNYLWLLKILPIGLLGLAVVTAKSSNTKTLLIGAVVFSGCGDLLLAFDQFIYGVGAFLIAQLSYALLFKGYWLGLQNRWYLSVLLILYVVLMAGVLLPKLGELQLPVLAYLTIIAAMGLLAVQSSLTFRWAVLGAWVFILSDSFIAINKFVMPLPFASYLIMSSYYVAQFMLVTSFLETLKKRSTD